MDFTPATAGSKPAVVQYSLNKDLQPVLIDRLKIGDTRGSAVGPWSSAPALHELDYGTRLISAQNAVPERNFRMRVRGPLRLRALRHVSQPLW